ncbi:MAG: hypothetical protein ACRDRD_23410, partial [Pseudonocardiaceae bacterium]
MAGQTATKPSHDHAELLGDLAHIVARSPFAHRPRPRRARSRWLRPGDQPCGREPGGLQAAASAFLAEGTLKLRQRCEQVKQKSATLPWLCRSLREEMRLREHGRDARSYVPLAKRECSPSVVLLSSCGTAQRRGSRCRSRPERQPSWDAPRRR